MQGCICLKQMIRRVCVYKKFAVSSHKHFFSFLFVFFETLSISRAMTKLCLFGSSQRQPRHLVGATVGRHVLFFHHDKNRLGMSKLDFLLSGGPA